MGAGREEEGVAGWRRGGGGRGDHFLKVWSVNDGWLWLAGGFFFLFFCFG